MTNLNGGVPADRARAALLPAVYLEMSADVTVVDVSDWATAVELSRTTAMGDPVLVCFGTHRVDHCPLSEAAPGFDGAHGVIFSTVCDRPEHLAFVERFRQLVKPGTPVRMSARPRAGAVLVDSKEQ